MFLSSFFL